MEDKHLKMCIRINGLEARVYSNDTIVYVDEIGKEFEPFKRIKDIQSLVKKALKEIGKEI